MQYSGSRSILNAAYHPRQQVPSPVPNAMYVRSNVFYNKNTSPISSPSTSVQSNAKETAYVPSNAVLHASTSSSNRSFSNAITERNVPTQLGPGMNECFSAISRNIQPPVENRFSNPGNNSFNASKGNNLFTAPSQQFNMNRGINNNNNNITNSHPLVVENQFNNRGNNLPTRSNLFSNMTSSVLNVRDNGSNRNKSSDNSQYSVVNQTRPNSKTQSSSTNIAASNKNESVRVFTGCAEKVLKWNRTNTNCFCYYEVIAPIISFQEGRVRNQKIFLLRDLRGPIIQIIHYIQDHIDLDDFCVGQMLRCVGRMVGLNIMHGISIRQATDEEISTVYRFGYICDRAILENSK